MPPTLLIVDDEERLRTLMLQSLEDFEDDFPGGVRREMMPGAAHFLHLEQPDEVHRLVLDWLNG